MRSEDGRGWHEQKSGSCGPGREVSQCAMRELPTPTGAQSFSSIRASLNTTKYGVTPSSLQLSSSMPASGSHDEPMQNSQSYNVQRRNPKYTAFLKETHSSKYTNYIQYTVTVLVKIIKINRWYLYQTRIVNKVNFKAMFQEINILKKAKVDNKS